MKASFLINLLVAFAIGLCGLCTYQWWRETRTRVATQLLYDERFKLHKEIQEHTNRIVQMDHQINDLTRQTAEQAGTIKSNRTAIDFLRGTTNSLSSSNDYLAKVLGAYTNAFNDTTNRLGLAYENISKQNEVIKDLVKERDGFVARLNEAISNRNETVKEYNNLVERVKEMQAQWEAALTNKNRKPQ